MRKQKIVKKYFREHPEVLDALKNDIHQYTDNIIKDEYIPDFEQFLARKKDLAQYFEEDDNNAAEIESNLPKSPWYRRKKIIVPIAVFLAACTFISFTPPGKALAENIYRTVVQWFDTGVNIQHGTSDTSIKADEENIEFYETIEEARSKLDIEIAHNNENELKDRIEVKTTDTLMQIRSTYTIDMQEVTITQTMYYGDTEWNTNIEYEDGQTVDEILPDGTRFVGYVHDGFGYAIAYIENMSVETYSDNIDYDNFIGFIQGITIK